MNEYYIPVSTERYPTLFSKTDSIFVDKSLFISDLFKKTMDDDVLLITRPRRCGKSLNLSMLHHFLASEVNGLPNPRII